MIAMRRGALFDVLRCGHQSGRALAGSLLHYRAAGEGGEGEVEEPAIIPVRFCISFDAEDGANQ